MWHRLAPLLFALSIALGACTSNPQAPINQAFPIKQMDHFFEGLSDPPPPSYSTDQEHEPGYAPAYPPYQP